MCEGHEAADDDGVAYFWFAQLGLDLENHTQYNNRLEGATRIVCHYSLPLSQR